MREIKFRGKKVNGSGWIYGMPNYQMTHIFNDSQVDSVDNYEVIPETIGQFTGLKDITNTEIYDGDILSGGFYLSYQVKWDYEHIGWNIGLGVNKYRIIGNIYDNPELLTKN